MQTYQRALGYGIAGRAWAYPWVVVGKAGPVLEGVGHNLQEPPYTGLEPKVRPEHLLMNLLPLLREFHC